MKGRVAMKKIMMSILSLLLMVGVSACSSNTVDEPKVYQYAVQETFIVENQELFFNFANYPSQTTVLEAFPNTNLSLPNYVMSEVTIKNVGSEAILVTSDQFTLLVNSTDLFPVFKYVDVTNNAMGETFEITVPANGEIVLDLLFGTSAQAIDAYVQYNVVDNISVQVQVTY